MLLFRTLKGWLSRIDKDTKEARNKRIVDMWLGCCTFEEIAKDVGCSVSEARNVVSAETAELPKVRKLSSEHPRINIINILIAIYTCVYYV